MATNPSKSRDPAKKKPAAKAKLAAKPKAAAKLPPAKTTGAKSVRKPATKTVAKAAKPAKVAPKRKAPAAITDPVLRLRAEVIKALDELKARDVAEIDVRGKTSIADYIIVASGTSSRHVKSVADEVVKYAKRAGMPPLGVEGQREAEWVLVDLGDIVVHVMLPRVREFYGLERLWSLGDAAEDEAAAG